MVYVTLTSINSVDRPLNVMAGDLLYSINGHTSLGFVGVRETHYILPCAGSLNVLIMDLHSLKATTSNSDIYKYPNAHCDTLFQSVCCFTNINDHRVTAEIYSNNLKLHQ